MGSKLVFALLSFTLGCAKASADDGSSASVGSGGASAASSGHASASESSSSGAGQGGGISTIGSSTSQSGSGGSGGSGGAPMPVCGDGNIDQGEDCEASNLGGKTCVDLGFSGGVLSCGIDCKYDTSKCAACGNGVIEPAAGEDCDFDANHDPLILATCMSLGFSSANNPGCDPTCHYDTTPCLCGNGVVDGAEACDGADLAGATCATQGFTAGMLACTAACTLDTSGCTKCGNKIVEAGEQCDDGNVMSGDGCSATCQTEVVACDPDGIYAVIMGGPISYSCCSGLVSVNVSSFIFSGNGATIQSAPSNPATMIGAPTTCPMGSFSNSGAIAGGCTETYALSGNFTGQDTWTGVYSVSFNGPDCDCFGGQLGSPCIDQLFPISAMR